MAFLCRDTSERACAGNLLVALPLTCGNGERERDRGSPPPPFHTKIQTAVVVVVPESLFMVFPVCLVVCGPHNLHISLWLSE